MKIQSTFKVMVIQSFLKGGGGVGNMCLFLFIDMG